MPVLLIDPHRPESRPLSRFSSLFSLRRGIFSTVEYLRRRRPQLAFYFSHPDKEYSRHIAAAEGFEPAPSLIKTEGALQIALNKVSQAALESALERAQTDAVISLSAATEWDIFALPEQIAENIERDLPLWLESNRDHLLQQLPVGIDLTGSPKELYIHRSAALLPGVVLDTNNGPVVIDAEVKISPFSYLQGPLYVGRQSLLDNVSITEGAVVGRAVRLGGEIKKSLIGDFSNKHHEGFVGHSIIGSWVNLGALTVTSDLKNNYGEVRLRLPTDHSFDKTTEIASGRLKFGAIIGDWVRTAIGTMLTTGTVIDSGANVFGQPIPKYIPPLAWGVAGDRYEVERFIGDAQKIAARRAESLPPLLTTMVRQLSRLSQTR